MYTKTITPAYQMSGKRKKLVGYIGELRDGEMLVHSMEYSTYSQAEAALDALAFELLSDLAEQGLVDDLPAFEPTTCVYCHKPHNSSDCPEVRVRLFAPRCVTCGNEGDCPDCDAIFISLPLDVEFAPFGPQA